MTTFVIEGINPEPWTASQSSTGKKNGKLVTRFFKDEKLRSYQEAVKESLRADYPDFLPLTENAMLRLFLWRRLDKGAQVMDTTNGQKALEDALQGVLLSNDRQDLYVTTILMSQTKDTEPLIIIKLQPWEVEPWLDISLRNEAAEHRAMRPTRSTTPKVRSVEGVF